LRPFLLSSWESLVYVYINTILLSSRWGDFDWLNRNQVSCVYMINLYLRASLKLIFLSFSLSLSLFLVDICLSFLWYIQVPFNICFFFTWISIVNKHYNSMITLFCCCCCCCCCYWCSLIHFFLFLPVYHLHCFNVHTSVRAEIVQVVIAEKVIRAREDQRQRERVI